MRAIAFVCVLAILSVGGASSRVESRLQATAKITKKSNVEDHLLNRVLIRTNEEKSAITITANPLQNILNDYKLEKTIETLKLVGLFTMWYAFNAGYNVFNAYMKKDFKKPWFTSTIQLLVGMLYALPLWASGVRALPNLTQEDIKLLFPIAALNAFGHASAVCAMFEKGGGSFTHVIKASEPVVSTILNLGINKIVPKPFTALSLLPITYGVAYASTLGQV